MKYRRINPRVWQDEKFVRLSKAKPNAQTLWLYLLTSDLRMVLPGVVKHMGPATLAECLGWTVAATKKCWAEIEAAGMAKADWTARVIWMPRALIHEPADNLNQIKGWRAAFHEIPSCPLKAEIAAAVQRFLADKPKDWWEAWGTPPPPVNPPKPEPPRNPSETLSEPLGNKGERERTGREKGGTGTEPSHTPEARAGAWLERYPGLHLDVRQVGYTGNPNRDFENAVRLMKAVPDDEELAFLTDLYLRVDHRDLDGQTRTPGRMLQILTALREHVRRVQPGWRTA